MATNSPQKISLNPRNIKIAKEKYLAYVPIRLKCCEEKRGRLRNALYHVDTRPPGARKIAALTEVARRSKGYGKYEDDTDIHDTTNQMAVEETAPRSQLTQQSNNGNGNGKEALEAFFKPPSNRKDQHLNLHATSHSSDTKENTPVLSISHSQHATRQWSSAAVSDHQYESLMPRTSSNTQNTSHLSLSHLNRSIANPPSSAAEYPDQQLRDFEAPSHSDPSQFEHSSPRAKSSNSPTVVRLRRERSFSHVEISRGSTPLQRRSATANDKEYQQQQSSLHGTQQSIHRQQVQLTHESKDITEELSILRAPSNLNQPANASRIETNTYSADSLTSKGVPEPPSTSEKSSELPRLPSLFDLPLPSQFVPKLGPSPTTFGSSPPHPPAQVSKISDAQPIAPIELDLTGSSTDESESEDEDIPAYDTEGLLAPIGDFVSTQSCMPGPESPQLIDEVLDVPAVFGQSAYAFGDVSGFEAENSGKVPSSGAVESSRSGRGWLNPSLEGEELPGVGATGSIGRVVSFNQSIHKDLSKKMYVDSSPFELDEPTMPMHLAIDEITRNLEEDVSLFGTPAGTSSNPNHGLEASTAWQRHRMNYISTTMLSSPASLSDMED
ncbi:hypothetical protein BJ742DRAFT_834794 [Cladochytrium replicatum]|nr:hypothetical protein BJ742DRAFT_834794 [Cladochytrium replicatum]